MAKTIDGPISNFAAPRANYPLLITGALVVLCLGGGIAVALTAGSRNAAALFGVAIPGVLAVIYLGIRQGRKTAVGSKTELMRWETTLPNVQRQDLNIEISELGRILDVDDEHMGDLLSAYIVAEDLALRQIQYEEKLPVLRHVNIGRSTFDGVLVKQDIITCIAVTFLVSPQIRKEKIDSMVRKMAAARETIENMKTGARARFLLVLVTQLDQAQEAELRSLVISEFTNKTPVTMDIRLLDFETLQRTYAIDN